VSEVRVRWLEGLKFLGSDAEKHSVLMDGSSDGLGFRPSQLLPIALAGCTGVDIVDILRKGHQQVTGLEIVATSSQAADPPWTFEEIHVEYVVRGRGLKEGTVARAIELSETKYCSVGATLSGKAKITSSFKIIEERE
jgi:putative redox protein